MTKNQRNYLRSEKDKKKSAGKQNKRKGTHIAVVQSELDYMAKMDLKFQAMESRIASLLAAQTTGEAEQSATKKTKVVRH